MHLLKSPAIIPVLGILMAMGTEGCAQKAGEEAKEHTVRKVSPEPPTSAPELTAESTTDAISETKEDFERTLNRSLDTLEEEIRGLKKKAEDVEAAAKALWAETIADLDAKRKAVEGKLDEVRKATSDAWERQRDGAKSAWKELETAVRKAQSEF